MKTFSIFALIISCSWFFTATAAPLGQDVQILQKNGLPKIGVQYSYDIDAISWSLTSTVLTQSLPPGRPLFVRAYNTTDNSFLSDWSPLDLGAGISSTEVLTLSLDRKSALETLKAFPAIALLFSSNQSTIEANLSFELICQNYPSSFADLTLGRNGCAPDKTALNALKEDTGGLCSSDLHKMYCASTYDGVREAIARRYQCYFKCN